MEVEKGRKRRGRVVQEIGLLDCAAQLTLRMERDRERGRADAAQMDVSHDNAMQYGCTM